MREQRTHLKSGAALFKFLKDNGRSFSIERTKTGSTTYEIFGKKFYIRPKQVSRGFLNKILQFQSQVSKGHLFKVLSRRNIGYLEWETEQIRKSLMYKGFCFVPDVKELNAVKIDLDSAYWRTSYLMKQVKLKLFRNVEKTVLKENRLRLTGTLGKGVTRTDYKEGEKKESYELKLKKKRIIFQNIYERVKKFVDELMVLCYLHNPDNFLGFYVDGFWLRQPDQELIDKLSKLYNIKVKNVILTLDKNKHNLYYIHETDIETGEILPYDAQFKKDFFANYMFLHRFDKNKIRKPNFIQKWNPII